MKCDETAAYYGEFPVDLCSGKHLIFIYTNIIEYQYVGDTKAPLLRVIDSKQRLKNGSVCELEPTHQIVFFQFRLQKTLIKHHTINIDWASHRNGRIGPFSGTGNVILTLQFKQFSN